MNKFSTIRTSVLFISFLFVFSIVKGQSVRFFPPSELSLEGNHSVQLAGKIDSNYLMYMTRLGSQPQLAIFDLQGKLDRSVPLSFIRGGFATNVNMIAHSSRLDIIVQEIRNGMHYTIIAGFNGKGELIITPRYIDSTRFDLYGVSAFYSIVSSPDKRFTALYRVVRGFSETQILIGGLLLNEKGEAISSASFYVPYSMEQEMTGRAFINNSGIFFMPVYDKPANYRVGTTLRIYQTNFSQQPLLTTIYLKEKKPTDFIMDWNEEKRQLVMGGIYYGFYEKRIDGAFTAYLTPQKNKLDTIIYMPLEKDFRKQLKSRIYNMSIIDAINALQVRYFKIEADGTANLLTDMFNNSILLGNSINRPLNSSETNADYFNNRTRNFTSTNSIQERDLASARNANNLASSRAIQDRVISNRGSRSSTPVPPSINEPPPVRNGSSIGSPTNFRNTSLSDAGDILSRNKTLDYKSVMFSVSSNQTNKWKNWTRNLYVPGTPFSNVIILPNKALGLLSYEINNKNVHYLKSNTFGQEGKVASQIVGHAGDPMLFYKKNAVMVDNNSLLTLYFDNQQNTLGLALITW